MRARRSQAAAPSSSDETTGTVGQRSEVMKALVWQGKRDVRVEEVPDPRIEDPTDAIVRITSSAICGSDLHLYEVLGPVHETRATSWATSRWASCEEIGAEVTDIAAGDRVVIPFNISCGHCFMCTNGLQSQCETTQVREQNKGAALFGYSTMYGSVPGGQAEYLRVPQAQYGPIKVARTARTSGTCSCPTSCPPRGRPSCMRIPRGRHPGGVRVGPGRAVRRPHRQALGPPGDRRRRGPGAAGDGRPARHRGGRPGRASTTSPTRCGS